MTVTISYEPFDRLIVSLRNDGLLNESDVLYHMIYKVSWTSGSELIGKLGQNIKKIMKEKISSLSDESKKNIKESMEMVKLVWPDFPG